MFLSGVQKKERWFIWALIVWILLAAGPRLLLASKPTFFGYFPALYVWSVVFWVVAIVLNIILSFKIDFVNVPETFEEEDQIEEVNR